MEPIETALIVAVPEAEGAVGRFRAVLDPAAGWGVPAHVTVLYPFLPPPRIDDDVLSTLTQAFAAIPRFDATFAEVKWFGDTVVWLDPQPEDAFRQLTSLACQRFPEAQPRGGPGNVMPHLTIGANAGKHLLTDAGATVAASLPIRAAVESVQLIAGAPAPESWRLVAEFRLRAA